LQKRLETAHSALEDLLSRANLEHPKLKAILKMIIVFERKLKFQNLLPTDLKYNPLNTGYNVVTR
jgi:hypothetical protein